MCSPLTRTFGSGRIAMTLRRHRRFGSWLVAALLGGTCQFAVQRSAHADDDSATETAAARALAVDGLKLAQAGKCDEAIPKLDRAEKIHHSAIVLSRLGECNVSVGKLVEGTEDLRKVLREPLPANPSPALSKAYEHAQIILDSAKPKIAALTISVGNKSQPTDLHLMVDGQAVPVALIDSELPADPGDHLVEATAPGYLKAMARVNLSTADKKTVTLKLEIDPNASVVAPHSSDAAAASVVAPAPSVHTAATESASSPPPVPPSSPSHAAAYVAWGMGVVGVGVGSAFGLIAMKDKHDIVQRCGSDACTADSSQSLDNAKRSGNISTIAFGVGGVGLLLGTVLYFTVGGSSQEAGSLSEPHRFAGLTRGRAMIGPGSVQLAADF
jgi:hypothetical protein